MNQVTASNNHQHHWPPCTSLPDPWYMQTAQSPSRSVCQRYTAATRCRTEQVTSKMPATKSIRFKMQRKIWYVHVGLQWYIQKRRHYLSRQNERTEKGTKDVLYNRCTNIRSTSSRTACGIEIEDNGKYRHRQLASTPSPLQQKQNVPGRPRATRARARARAPRSSVFVSTDD